MSKNNKNGLRTRMESCLLHASILVCVITICLCSYFSIRHDLYPFPFDDTHFQLLWNLSWGFLGLGILLVSITCPGSKHLSIVFLLAAWSTSLIYSHSWPHVKGSSLIPSLLVALTISSCTVDRWVVYSKYVSYRIIGAICIFCTLYYEEVHLPRGVSTAGLNMSTFSSSIPSQILLGCLLLFSAMILIEQIMGSISITQLKCVVKNYWIYMVWLLLGAIGGGVCIYLLRHHYFVHVHHYFIGLILSLVLRPKTVFSWLTYCIAASLAIQGVSRWGVAPIVVLQSA